MERTDDYSGLFAPDQQFLMDFIVNKRCTNILEIENKYPRFAPIFRKTKERNIDWKFHKKF